jgi:hypothetical protein
VSILYVFRCSVADIHSTKYSFNFSIQPIRDSSIVSTLKNRLLDRLKNSKVVLLIATEFASINRGLLNWEIEKTVDSYGLPIISCYPRFDWVQAPAELSDRWPDKLQDFVNTDSVKTIHVPFKQAMVEEAINQFSVHNPPSHTLTYYLDSVYQKHGIK